MKKENGKIYYEVDDILYYPHPDTNNKEYIIEKLTVASIENGITHFKDPKYYQCWRSLFAIYSIVFK